MAGVCDSDNPYRFRMDAPDIVRSPFWLGITGLCDVRLYHFHRVLVSRLSLSPGIDIEWVWHVDTSYYIHRVSIWSDIDITWVYHVNTSYYFYQLSMWLVIDITWVSMLTCTTFTGYYHVVVTFAGYQYHLDISCWYLILLLSAINVMGITYPALFSFGYVISIPSITFIGYQSYRIAASLRYVMSIPHITFIGYSVIGYRHHLGINVEMYHFHRVLLMLLSLLPGINISWVCHVDTSYYFYWL
jgi:hypothetical protein